MMEPLSWKKQIWTLLLFYLPWCIAGWLFGYMPWLLFFATLLQLLWHLHHQIRLSTQLHHEKRLPSSAIGSWSHLFNALYHKQQKQYKKRKELTDLIRRFRNGAESLPDAIVVFRDQGHIVWCNRLAQHLLGFRWPDDIEQPISNLLRTPDFILYLQKNNFDEALEMASPIHDERMLELRIVPYTQGERLMVIRDITQLKQLEGMRRNFFANVSHELKTPMTVLQGYLEMTENPNILMTSMWPKAHSVMTDQLHRMNSLIEQLLTLSKIEAAPMDEFDEQVNVPAILSILEKEAMTLSDKNNHELFFEVDRHLHVLGNEEQLRSALSNLIHNAIKYTPANSEIRVRWYETKQGARFEVADTGNGIAPQHVHRLTERFYRVDKARSRDTGGSGLGLAIVKHALSHHDSFLDIQSEVGVGSLFSFTLPSHLIVK